MAFLEQNTLHADLIKKKTKSNSYKGTLVYLYELANLSTEQRCKRPSKLALK